MLILPLHSNKDVLKITMKCVIFLITITFFAGCTNEQVRIYPAKASPFFNDSTWGKTSTQIEQSENLSMFGKKYGELSYSGYVRLTPSDSLSTIITYYFQSDRLNRAQYFLQFSSKNEQDYLTMVRKVLSLFRSHYGRPISSDSTWNNGLYVGNFPMRGRAVKLGHLTFNAHWNTDATVIKFGEWSDLDGQLTFSVEYLSEEYKNSFSIK